MPELETAREWDVVVPDSGDQLLAELRRHGVRPGQRLHLSVTPEAEGSADDIPEFFGSFGSGRVDLAERSAEILRAGSSPR